MKAIVKESHVICKQPTRYIGWPTIARTPEGELLSVFSGDRDGHVCPFGKTFLTRSTDNGHSWTPAELINDTPLDDRDAGICVCADGTIVVSWFTSHYQTESYMRMCSKDRADEWHRLIDAVGPAELRQWAGESVADGRYQLGHWIRRSTDSGQTWEDPVRVPPTAPHGPIQLSDGRLMFVGIETIHGRSERDGNVLAAESSDQGKTWSVSARINMFPEYKGDEPDGYGYLCEPHVVETSPGNLLAMARYEERPYREGRRNCYLWQFTSNDGGHTWTEPEETPILGKPPHLTSLRDGAILVSYGFRHEPFGERTCLSRDEGKTWEYSDEFVLRDDAPNGDLGYPASVELDDGDIYTIYYQQEHAGEKTCLMGTRWSIA